ncbi:alpha/beta hydrolase [Ramlibacter sp.]|uniref:alpha/beta fold hydrolase n=1 Tax=Ramlibacter sp. TaxID=1917967 RepID=UPI0017BEF5F3|nr:alpha/beta hydrolase [Ramlibacter sp.]MBA2673900.1 alpha/beta hydrolase [Ramlibacter sp.]
MTTWVLLRGLAREAGHWGEVLPMLRERVPAGDAVVALDTPGNGTLWQERSPMRVEAMVASCRARLAQQGAQPPYLLAGLSLGGMVALDWAARYAGELAGCALANSSFAGLSPFWHRLRPSAYAQALALLRPGMDLRTREHRVLLLTSNTRPVDARTEQRWIACAQAHPVSHANMLRQLVAAARHRIARLPPAVPMLLLASRADRLVSVRCSQALAAHWKLPLHLHASAGHDLAVDDPHWLLDQLLSFRAHDG